MWKKFCLAVDISRTIDHDCHMVQICKIIISRGVFSILKFWFFKFSWGWKGKKWPKMTKFSSTCVKWWNLQQIFSFFQNFYIGFFIMVKRAKDNLKWPISVGFAQFLRSCRSYRFCHEDFENDIYSCISLFF